MRVAVTGATGFVGGCLLSHLVAAGHEPVALVRAQPDRDPEATVAGCPGARARGYDPFDAGSAAAALEGCEAVVNLAGKNILGGRWTDAFLDAARKSRIETTATLVDAMAAMDPTPRVLVSASAIGWYGARDAEERVTEDDDRPGDDVLAELCVHWEAAARGAEDAGTRVVLLRIGIVLGKDGGALSKMERPFKWGVGGRVASGRQVMSWIHVDDLCRLILFSLENDAVDGPVNAAAPSPVTNRELTKALGKQLRRPTILPVPGFVLRLMFGRGALILTTGQRVLPEAAQAAGFTFEHETVADALADLYPR